VNRREFVETLAVASGEAIFGQAIARCMIHFFLGSARRGGGQGAPRPDRSETPNLGADRRGPSQVQIAQRLLVNDETVRNHVSNVFSKLQVAHRAEAIVRAREAGLGREGGAV
jgi:DNA-binding NarL/FixJ family response regulator